MTEESERERLERRTEDKRRKALLALEDEQAMTVAKKERLLHLARKYYTKWHALHLHERVGTPFDVIFCSPLNII